MHPEYIWKDIFRPVVDEKGAYDLLSRPSLHEAINVLESDSSYELDDELYADFASKQTFKSSATATKHIQKNPARHREKFVEMVKAGLDEKNMLQLLKFIAHKPTPDYVQVRKNIEIKRAELEAEYQARRKQFSEELHEADLLRRRFRAIMETDEFKQYQETRTRNSKLEEENRILRDNDRVLREQVATYKPFYDNLESYNKNRLDNEEREMGYWEKAKIECEKKTKKHEIDCEKKIRKAQQDAEEAVEKIEKKLRKAKDEIKALKQEVITSKLRAKAKAKSDSDSDSD